jgi:serine/threonine-protein kinase RsbW
MTRYSFTYPNLLEAESSMYEHLKEVLIANQVAPDEIHKCMVVLSEAFTNAYLHGNKGEPTKHVSISLSINENWLAADIIDEGSESISESMQNAAGEAGLPDAGAENGRGLMLMRHYADEVRFSQADNGGLKVTVRFKRGTNKEEKLTQV